MLTHSHQKTLDFIRLHWLKEGRSPSFAEVAQGIGISSQGVIHRYIHALIEAGYLVNTPGRKRGLRLANDPRDGDFTLPLLGRIAAGQPIEAIPGEGILVLTSFIMGPNRYALRVSGESMVDAGILDGDTVIIEACDIANDGDMVVALIDRVETTLKHLKHGSDGSVQLIAANPAFPPMTYTAERIRIQGVVVGALRYYR